MVAGQVEHIISRMGQQLLQTSSSPHHAHFILFLKHLVHNKNKLDAGIADVAIHLVVLCGIQHAKVGVKYLSRSLAGSSNCTQMLLVSRVAGVAAGCSNSFVCLTLSTFLLYGIQGTVHNVVELKHIFLLSLVLKGLKV